MPETRLFAARALLPDGWARDVLFEIAPDGGLAAVTLGAEAGTGVEARELIAQDHR